MTVDPQLGRVLADRYRIDEPIGHGGMSTVYRAFDSRLQRSVAVKIFEPNGEDDARWESEIRLLSQLSHPHLVTLHDAHLEPRGSSEPSYLVMEYVPGQSLQQHLTEFGPSVSLAAMVISEIGEALATVHLRRIIHRDVKPGNILLERSDIPPLHLRAKLADFGIAHLLGDDRLTRTGTMIGTAAYTSPEQVRGEPATTASDVYSLGLVAVEAMTGRSPFTGTAAEKLMARLSRDPEMPADLGAGWSTLLRAMTAADPRKRPTAIGAAMTARELESEFDAAALAPGRRPAHSTTAVTEAMPAPTRVLPAAAAPPAGEPLAGLAEFPTAAARRGAASSRTRRMIAGAAIAAFVILLIVMMSSPQTRATSPATPPATTPAAAIVPPAAPPPSSAPSPIPARPKPGNGHGKGKG